MKDPHPNSWTCPSCNKKHDKPHWKDHHQKEPGWKDKPYLGWDKDSNPDFEFVCESCGHELIEKPSVASTMELKECPDGHGLREGNFCNECGEELIPQEPERKWCIECEAERDGIPAPLFCPHCNFEEERFVLLRV